MESLRINTGTEIEVNDKGECIVAYMSDQNFVAHFYDMVDKMTIIAKKMDDERIEKLSVAEKLKKSIESSRDMMNEIDHVFGEDACRKIFGADVIPTGYAIADFFDQLLPIFEKNADERQKKINDKYNRNRKGNRQQRRLR